MSKFFNLISTQLQQVLEFLNSNPRQLGRNSEMGKQSSSGLCHYCYYSGGSNNSELQDCSICLAKIQQREQVTKLRCTHLFHRACLDRWFGSSGLTCPLCRDNLALTAAAADGGGVHVLELRFVSATSLRSSDDRDSLWLR